MNKKKLFGMLVALVLVAALGIGATLAYFTDTTETLTNVVTMGKVGGIIAENNVEKDNNDDYQFNEDVVEEEGVEYEDVMPGDYIPKNPSVILDTDSEDAWIRVKLTFDWVKLNDTDKAILETAVLDAIDSTKWVKNATDGMYYYQTKMTAPVARTGNYIKTLTDAGVASKIATLFEGFKIDENLMNTAAAQNFKIILTADIIQADNVKLNDAGDAWVAEADGAAITFTADGATKVKTALADPVADPE